MFRISSKKALHQGFKCLVEHLIPGEQIEINYTSNSTGQDILDSVCRELDLLDKDYYGLKLHNQIQWLDMTKSVTKQTKGIATVVLLLRFKYYPAEPALLANESTRYYLYLQLRNDLLEGRLRSDSQDVLAYLIACILQSELGDASNLIGESHDRRQQQQQTSYVTEYKFVPNQSEELETEAMNLHQNEDFQGLSQSDSELNFLKKACQLDTYGIDPYPVKEGNSQDHFLIGVSHKGISTFRDSILIDLFGWNEIERISLDNKHLLIYCRRPGKKGDKSNKTIIGFRCPSQAYAENFWKVATEHRYFFTLETTPNAPIKTNTGGLFKKSHKLKYVGRVEKDLLRDHVDEGRSSGVKRSRSLMAKTNNGPTWRTFQQQQQHFGIKNNLQQSLSNMRGPNDHINKTLPPDMNYFREDEEDMAEDQVLRQDQRGQHLQNASGIANQSRPSFGGDTRERSSLASKDSPKVLNRRQVLQTKAELAATSAGGSAVRRGSQVFMESNESTHDFIKASAFLVLLLIATLLIILLISDSDRPNSVSLLVKKMNLEPLSVALRQNYYLPLKSALRHGFKQIFTALDKKII